MPETEIEAALDVLESWLTRRMLVRATSKSYNKIMAEVVTAIRQDESRQPGRIARDFFSSHNAKLRTGPTTKRFVKSFRSYRSTAR